MSKFIVVTESESVGTSTSGRSPYTPTSGPETVIVVPAITHASTPVTVRTTPPMDSQLGSPVLLVFTPEGIMTGSVGSSCRQIVNRLLPKQFGSNASASVTVLASLSPPGPPSPDALRALRHQRPPRRPRSQRT